MTREQIDSLRFTDDGNHRIISHSSRYVILPEGRIQQHVHEVIRIGKNARSAASNLYTFDSPMQRLLEFQARVMHKSGAREELSTGNLQSRNLSGSDRIGDRYLRYSSSSDPLAEGDIIERYTSHELVLGHLGITFSLSDLPYPAENISCVIEYPHGDSLSFKVVNDSVTPAIAINEKNTAMTFRWPSYSPGSQIPSPLAMRNGSPALLATVVRPHATPPSSWREFGDWYIDLVKNVLQPSPAVKSLAMEITAGITGPKEKMDAIFLYCQKNIRYEQVYLELGEIIPNSVETILSRKYGDCKDYSAIMHAMATSVGLDPRLVLCYRGRGVEFHDDIAVSQFNHMILYLEHEGSTYWYDGTNRNGLPGMTTFDLANATALVVEPGNSRLQKIRESPHNNLKIRGALQANGAGLEGSMSVTLQGQYAIDFFFLTMYNNRRSMKQDLTDWVNHTLNGQWDIDSIGWRSEGDLFTVDVVCRVPNVVTSVGNGKYISFGRVFNRLFPALPAAAPPRDAFYFPGYNRVTIDLSLTNLLPAENPHPSPPPTAWRLSYALPAGPFTDIDRTEFLEALDTIGRDLGRNHKFTEGALQ